MRRRAKPAKVGRKDSPKTDDGRIRDLEQHLAEARQREAEALKRESEALEQQKATSEILQVMSRSPTQVGPVLEAVVISAARLCEAHDVAMLLVDGDDLRIAAGIG